MEFVELPVGERSEIVRYLAAAEGVVISGDLIRTLGNRLGEVTSCWVT